LLAGAVKVIVAWVSPAVATTAVGAPGDVTGVTGLLAGDDATLVKFWLLVAMTVKVYGVPLVKPFTVMAQAAGPAQVPVSPPGLEVAV
jgi:hypothetical protein